MARAYTRGAENPKIQADLDELSWVAAGFIHTPNSVSLKPAAAQKEAFQRRQKKYERHLDTLKAS